MNLIEHFDKGVEANPQQICVVDARTAKTYAEVQRNSHRIAHALSAMGVEPGAKIALLSENTASAFECMVGVLRAGNVLVPIGPNQAIEDTIAMLSNIGIELLLYTQRHRAPAIEIIRNCPSVRTAAVIDGDDRYSSQLSSWTTTAPETDLEIHRRSDDPVTMISSGGTTGRPKGVVMTNRCWETFIAGLMLRYHGIRPVHLVSSPITHTAGGAALALTALGATNVLLDGFEPRKIMAAVAQHRVTHLFMPPAAVRLLAKHPDVRNHDYSSLRFFIFGGAPMPLETLKEAVDIFGPVMTTAFGQTETGGDITFFTPAEIADALARGDEQRLRSCGRATPFMRVAVMDHLGNLLGAGEIGEIVVRSDQVMKGYCNDDAETVHASRYEWHHTGDLGYCDDDGYYYLVDRKRDVIIAGGFNVFPSVVEQVIRQHAAVQECVVVGVPDEDWGEVPVAVVQPRNAETVNTTELHALCEAKLAPLQRPRTIELWQELPRGHGGKISRRFVRDKLITGTPLPS